ncbi:FAD binding domain-containing protein [Mycolicibacterium confluentis]|uniref:Carbon monoxide dehydrogenase n=1 Tax=Mycolicibacterium confluentis TaxID=28047 RepID=A0A7I7XVX0_9MYCO|nr:xanthine dehydrogenase family protein subunit M [Mycolicibacterium confluentis]MCV7321620.1 xanthine dehydrogenase family protein subunit M [Mycolicibacterium confluentis]ORV31915.1 carbon monoxide dehydrogenase [Mycolicibacterium confluentis]BBZ33429.1 carbon monoxide dehydrogenase [Mycolicibacterium confluentis]
MKPAPFAYHRPRDLEDVVDLLDEFGDDGKILAGGQSLTAMLALRLTHFDNLIDISRLAELQYIERRADTVWVGAGITHAEVGAHDLVRTDVPLLTKVTPLIGHFQIRNRGTLGGAVAHADPAGEFPTVALTLDATIEATSSSGRRTIPATEFFTGLWETSMAPSEVLTAVGFPVWGARSGFAVHEFARRHGDFAIAGATVATEVGDDDRVRRCAIGLMGLSSTPRRAFDAEQAVIGQKLSDVSAEELGQLAMRGLDDVPSDLQGSAGYRTRVGAAMVSRAWTDASTEAARESVNA